MDSAPLIGAEQADLVGGAVSIQVGSRDAALRPHLVRAIGCRLSGDRRRLELLLPRRRSAQVLQDLQDNGRIAVVFSQPASNRTLQVKGDDATVGPCGREDLELADRYLRMFTDEIGRLGFAAEVAHTMLGHDGEIAVVRFTIDAAFEQTPGPNAGERLGAPAG